MHLDENKTKRDRWMSRPTFILAAIGSAVGLGNFWRFPSLMFRAGGAGFFIPYLFALFFLGIPLLLLELGLGQKFQRGDIGVFRGMMPRLWGIGLASVIGVICIAIYYNLIIAWSLQYLILSFKSPLLWSTAGNVHLCAGKNAADDYFNKDFLHIWKEDCSIL
jgi:SNF family Na+-dependent transporter